MNLRRQGIDDERVLMFFAGVHERPPDRCVRMPDPTPRGIIALFWYAHGRGWVRARRALPARKARSCAWWTVHCREEGCRHLFVLTELGARELALWRRRHASK